MVEELVLQPPEESLARRVVGTASLRRHASDQAVLVADPYPLRPSVVPAAVRVDRRLRAGPPLGDRLLEARVGEALAGVAADRPRRGPAVEAVDHGAEVDLAARRQAELGYVGQPQHVRPGGAEIAPDQVLRRLRHLAGVRAVPPPPAP